MTNEPSFKMSQDYELIPPQKKRAYPILIEEWEHLKKKIRSISDNANIYHTIGSALIGVAGSALVMALTLNIPPGDNSSTPMPILISWFIFVSALICGGLSIFFGKTQRKVQNSNTNDVIEQFFLLLDCFFNFFLFIQNIF